MGGGRGGRERLGPQWGRGRKGGRPDLDAWGVAGVVGAARLQGRPWKPVFPAVSFVPWRPQSRCGLPACEALMAEPHQLPDTFSLVWPKGGALWIMYPCLLTQASHIFTRTP